MKTLDKFSNEELLDLYKAALVLKKVHDNQNGLEQYKDHYEHKENEYREEIIRRMKQCS